MTIGLQFAHARTTSCIELCRMMPSWWWGCAWLLWIPLFSFDFWIEILTAFLWMKHSNEYGMACISYWFSCSRIPPDGFQGMDYEWSVQEITSIRRFRSEEHKADHRRRGLDDDAAGSCKSPMAADGCALWQESVCNKNTKTDQKMPVPTTVLSRLSCS